MRRWSEERGIALVLALMGMVALMTLGGALAVLMTTEIRIAAGFRDGLAAFYAAEAGIARALVDVRATSWESVRAGTSRSSVTDRGMDLRVAARDIEAVAGGRGWRPYAYGTFADFVPGAAVRARLAVVVWVAADPVAVDTVIMRSHAYAAGGVRRMVGATVANGPQGPRVIAWREWR